MAFDRNNQADLTALRSEVLNDPIGMGYDPAVLTGSGSTPTLLRQLNDGDLNVGGETTNQDLDAEALLDVIDTSDFASNQVDQGERDWLKMCFDFAIRGGDIERYRSKIRAIFQAQSTTIANIDALTRRLGRAEVLFGEGTNIGRDDWFAARDSV